MPQLKGRNHHEIEGSLVNTAHGTFTYLEGVTALAAFGAESAFE
jgi:hypothetical protein